jgi:hypothetical protein
VNIRPHIRRCNTSAGLVWQCHDGSFAGFADTPLSAFNAWRRCREQILPGVTVTVVEPSDDEYDSVWPSDEDLLP